MNEAQVKSEAKIQGIVRNYRLTKADYNILGEHLKRWRGMLQNLLPILDGKWQDADGYARIEEYKETYSYDKAKVDDVIDGLEAVAGKRDDPGPISEILRDIANALREARKPRKGYTTVKVK